MSTRARMRPRHIVKRAGERHAMALGVVVLAIVGYLTWVAITSVNSAPFSSPFRVNAVVPGDAPIVRAGDEVRIAGVRVGDVRDVRPAADGRLVLFDLDHGPVGQDATITVRQRGFSGSVYLELTRGNASTPLGASRTIPRAQTAASVDLSTVASAFKGDVQQAITRTFVGYGGGLQNRGGDINALLADLPGFARDVQPVARGLTPAPGALSGLLHQLDLTSAGFAPAGTSDLGPLVSNARATLDVTSRQGGAIGHFFESTRPFEDSALTTLPVADPLLADATSMSRELTPALAQLNASLPDLNGLLDQSRKLTSLSSLARAAEPVLSHATPLLPELTPVGRTLPPLFARIKPLTQGTDPYRADMVRDMQLFLAWSGFAYSEGLAKGERAVRFGPVFTCHRPRNPYPAPGQAAGVKAANLPGACQ